MGRTWRAASSQHSALDAAGIAFFGVWAFFPALAALVALGGVLFGRPEILHLLSRVRVDLPESFAVVVVGQLQAIASQFTRLNPLLGSLGAFTIFFLWSYLTVLAVLLGAQVNTEIEHQAEKDTTSDRSRSRSSASSRHRARR